MGDLMPVIAGQIVVMFLIMAVGFGLFRARFLTDAGVSQMSDLVLFVANPILIARALMRDFDGALLVGGLQASLVTAVLLSVSLVVARLVYRNVEEGRAAIARFSVTFSNAGFIGLPLAAMTIGDDGVFYISVINTVQTVLLWTYGVTLVSGDRSQMSVKNVIANPCIIAMAVGLVCFMTSWRPPELICTALDNLGSLNTGLVMLVLGAYLGGCSVKKTLTDPAILKLCGVRLAVMPLVTLGIIMACVQWFGLNEPVAVALLMYEAMPIAAVASLFAYKYGDAAADGPFATGAVAASTLISLATLPLFMMALSICLGTV